jgi:Ca2+-binding RTX toxin-like protein
MPNNPQEVQEQVYTGTANNDVVYDQGAFHTQFYGLGGNDVFFAHANDSVFSSVTGLYQYIGNLFDGGTGTDTVNYVLSNKKIAANLGTGVVDRIFDGQVYASDNLNSIEDLIGSNFSDTINGSSGANRLHGGGGHDTINGRGGNDHVFGDWGNDTLEGGNGADTMDGGTGNDVMGGGNGADTMNGSDGADTIEGDMGNDVLKGGAHNDTLRGQIGDDRLEGGSGNDTINGGTGNDTVVYTGSSAVEVNLWFGHASGAWGNDTLSNIERVETGNGNDVVLGTNGNNRFTVAGGNDTVYAFDGHDTVNAGSGADSVYGYDGNDTINGGSGGDKLWGGGDGDTVNGDDGADKIKGEGGNDFLFGGNHADWINGGDGLDTINGQAGADVIAWLAGDSGEDFIAGFNLAQDRLYFGAGFFAVEPVGAVQLDDVLTTFHAGEDTLLFANTAEHGWELIARFENVDADDLEAMIESENILAATVNFGGGPGGLHGGQFDEPLL